MAAAKFRADIDRRTLFQSQETLGSGGSSSGSASDHRSRGPGFDSHCRWELGFFSLYISLLFPIFQSVVRP